MLRNFPKRVSSTLDSDFSQLPEHRTERYLKKYIKGHGDDGPRIIAREVAATGILVEDPMRRSSFRLAHKSFFEYLLAEAFVIHKYGNIGDVGSDEAKINEDLGFDYERPMPFESVTHAANIIRMFNFDSKVRLARNAIDRIISRHAEKWDAVGNIVALVTFSTWACVAMFYYPAGWLSEWTPSFSRALFYFAFLFKILGFSLIPIFVVAIGVALRAGGLDLNRTNTVRVFIAYKLMFERRLTALLYEMPASRLYKHLIGNNNVLYIGGMALKILKETNKDNDRFWQVSADKAFSSVETLHPVR